MKETNSEKLYTQLEKILPNGEVLFPGSKAYQNAVFF